MPKPGAVGTAAYEVEIDCANFNPVEIARVIGTFYDDAPDTPFQRAYLHALWKLLLRRLPPRMLADAFDNQTGAKLSQEKLSQEKLSQD